ncbi:hypothetical protein H4219_001022 [Mycoemilia scoparia]|uniref:Saccharopine dehydrogenase (NAD(+), L-glutamate-forming) n=1 Tax=Mycoemilia scoparia TaxID=417184 RepID=A0A9W8A5U5_9FUNG|nr:hypothetical protein H4219_001022 [Mycoemilia scoparia]
MSVSANQISSALSSTASRLSSTILGQSTTSPLRTFATTTTAAAAAAAVAGKPGLQAIGIRRENKNRWERRVPLLPQHVAQLIKETGTKVIVQPSTKRIVPDEAYAKAGAIISEDLSAADVILGIKEVPIEQLIPNKTFVVFSHTHKGQDYNMPTLKAVLEKNIRLLDYELLVDPESKKRLVLFGKFAGYAGMIDCIHGLGQRLLGLGYHTPFIHVAMAHMYPTLTAARKELNTIGELIKEHGLPNDFGPFVFTFTGSGNVSQGAQSVFRELPHEYVTPDQLATLVNMKPEDRPADYNKKVYGVVVNAPDYLVRKDGGSYDRAEYRAHPDRYESQFITKIAPYTSVLVNGLFWSTEFPRLMTNEHLREFQANPRYKSRMLSLMDITCDIGGSFEFMSHASTIGDPFFYVNALGSSKKLEQHKDVEKGGIQINSIDNLPTELPLEASETFANALYPFAKAMALNKFNDDPVLTNARITDFGGTLLEPHLHLTGKLEALLPPPPSVTKDVSEPGSPTSTNSSITTKTPDSRQKVLVVGSGRVVGPLLDYLHAFPNIEILLASNQLEEAKSLAKGFDRVTITDLDVSSSKQLDALVSQSDVVVRFLVPASLHPTIARSAIRNQKSVITASYISDEMKAAKDSSVTILNEIGLDPGIDHCSAMKVIDEIHKKGHKLTSFISWCGGLVAPDNSNNALGYKFSWSPRGVLTAGLNPAKFKLNGQVETIEGTNLMKQHFSNVPLYKGFAFEGLANRNSLDYVDVYGLNIDHLNTMLRGTLRFKGYADLMEGFRRLGLLDPSPVVNKIFENSSNYTEFMQHLLGTSEIRSGVALRLGLKPNHPIVERIVAAFHEFGIMGPNVINEPIQAPSTLDAFCHILQRSLTLNLMDRDMVCMVHEFEALTPKGNTEIYKSSLVAYGDPASTHSSGGSTAMAKTVGIPAAVATHLLLQGKIKTKGVIRPTLKEIYEPMLDILATQNITFNEEHFNSAFVSMKPHLKPTGTGIWSI